MRDGHLEGLPGFLIVAVVVENSAGKWKGKKSCPPLCPNLLPRISQQTSLHWHWPGLCHGPTAGLQGRRAERVSASLCVCLSAGSLSSRELEEWLWVDSQQNLNVYLGSRVNQYFKV